MRKMLRSARARGQALVEFALAATLIFFLLGAAVDVGLIFFTLQELRTATQEGATYGSYPVAFVDGSGDIERVDLNYPEIVRRVRDSAGDTGSGFANLIDLNTDGTDDLNQGIFGANNSGNDPNGYIYIENLKDANLDGDPSNDGGAACATDAVRSEMRRAGEGCYIRVSMRYDYRMIFPLLPSFADVVPLRVSYILKVRSSFTG